MRFLIIEDDFVSTLILEDLLKNYGTCKVLSRPQKVFDIMDEILDNTFDIIFLDIMMPEIDGIEILKAIRNEEDKKNDLKKKNIIVMQSALNEKSIIEESKKNDCNDFLEKPLNIKQLEVIISKYK
jgi:CheY-like chemotaxis protein